MNIPYELISRYLAGECNDAERREIEKWIRENPGMMKEFSRIWDEISVNEFTPDVEKALQKVNQRIDSNNKAASRTRRLYTFIGSAAAVILILIISVVTIMNRGDVATGVSLLALTTGENETLEYTLPDGSKVWLNHSSRLSYPETFNGNNREVQLEGEAFFDVMPNTNQPFIIEANNTLTQVVGTSFGVRAVTGENDVVVTVATGIINFSAQGNNTYIQLKKGEQGICNPQQKKLEKAPDPDPNLLAWKTKKLVFRQLPLIEVAGIIENAYQTPVTVDSSIQHLQINGTYEQLPLDDLIHIIEITLQIQAETGENGIILMGLSQK